MTRITARQAETLIERYRVDLEDLDRRIRILEWLSASPASRPTTSRLRR